MIGTVRAAELTLMAAAESAARTGVPLPSPERDVDGKSVAHALWMITEIDSGAVEGNKAHRWLGYLQGLLVMHDIVDLAEMKSCSLQASEEEQS